MQAKSSSTYFASTLRDQVKAKMRTQEQEKSKAAASTSPPVKSKKKASVQKAQSSHENPKSNQRPSVGKKSATAQFNTVF